nr:MAG TPA: hypothetical protein [Caudoviricetes sp.]
MGSRYVRFLFEEKNMMQQKVTRGPPISPT